jgi:hypothetical protein
MQADIRAPNEPAGDQKGVRLDPLVGRRQGVETAPELVQPAGLDPARELAPNIGPIDISREEKPGFEDGLLPRDLQDMVELHGSKMP